MEETSENLKRKAGLELQRGGKLEKAAVVERTRRMCFFVWIWRKRKKAT